MSGYTTVATGQRLGDYELVARVARGGMADIYLGRRTGHAGVTKHVAIKVLTAERANDPDARALFLDEARLVGLLEHENIAAVLDVAIDDGVHFLAMEYVHGCDLRDVLLQAQRREVSLPYEASVAIVAAAADGLDHAHSRCTPDGAPLKLVHRDVSLSNLMVGYDGAVKVVDFGIAASTLSRVVAPPGVVRGKAAYMSPEQCMGEPLDHRTDVFALGVVLYELTTGARCFNGSNDFERMLAVVRGDYLQPRDLVRDYPADLERVVRTALSIDAGHRYATAAALIAALVEVSASHAWQLGPATIARSMHRLFGAVAEPWVLDPVPQPEPAPADVGDTDVVAMLCDACASASAPSRSVTLTVGRARSRFPRGSVFDLARAETLIPDDDDHLTGRRRFTRRGYAVALAA